MDFDALVEVKSGLGTAAVIVMDKSVSIIAPCISLVGLSKLKINLFTGRCYSVHCETNQVLSTRELWTSEGSIL